VKAASSLVGKLHPQRRTLSNATCDSAYRHLSLSGTLQFLAGTATLILAMFCLVNLTVSLTSRTPNQRVWVPYLVPALALIFNLVLVAFASQESHILALVFTGVEFC